MGVGRCECGVTGAQQVVLRWKQGAAPDTAPGLFPVSLPSFLLQNKNHLTRVLDFKSPRTRFQIETAQISVARCCQCS